MELISRMPDGAATGAAVLFVHGAWHGAWAWEPHFLPYFASRGHPAYAVSLRGHESWAPKTIPRGLRIRDYADDVAAAVRETGTLPVVVGHSMGGFVVQHYLRRHEARAAVLLASVPPSGALGISLRFAARHPAAFARVIATARLWPVVASAERARRNMTSGRLSPQEWAPHQASLHDEAFAAYLDMLGLALPRGARPRAPVLVLGAGGDQMVTVAEVRKTAQAYGAECDILPDIGHDVMLDPDWRLVADRILAWISKLEG